MEVSGNLRRSVRLFEHNQSKGKQNQQEVESEETSSHSDSLDGNREEQKVAPLGPEQELGYRVELNPLVNEMRSEKEIINELMRSLQRLDKLWDMAMLHEERMNANERKNKSLVEHLEVTTAVASQRIQESVDEYQQQVEQHQQQVEERLSVIENIIGEKIELQNRGIIREVETLKRQVDKMQKSQMAVPMATGASNHHPFGARNQGLQTPGTSTSTRTGVFTCGRTTDDGDVFRVSDLMGIEEFAGDVFTTPEERRDEYDRRNSLGGGSIFNAILAPVEASNTYMISSVTRESYSQVVLKDISLDSVGPFMNQYLNIKRKHPGQAWMIVDFCSEYTKQELTVLADTYELPGAALGLGGAFALTDRQVLFLILEKLKARSMDDFVTRLQGIRFLEEDSDLDYTKQYNYEKLFRAALSFRFRFVMRVQLLGSRAKAEHIPPLHKMGQTPGLLTYFFNAWPAGTGKSLFSRHFTPEMRAQTDLKSFFKLFFAKNNSYRDVKQGYDDLGSVLSSQQRERDGDGVPTRASKERVFVKREGYSNSATWEQRQQDEHKLEQRDRGIVRQPAYEVTKKLWTPDRERRDQRPKMLHHVRGAEDDGEAYELAKGEWGQEAGQR